MRQLTLPLPVYAKSYPNFACPPSMFHTSFVTPEKAKKKETGAGNTVAISEQNRELQEVGGQMYSTCVLSISFPGVALPPLVIYVTAHFSQVQQSWIRMGTVTFTCSAT